MITFHAPGQPCARLSTSEQCAELTRTAVWIDLLEPTPAEEQTLEAALGIDIPTREEMQAIELSSRLYEEEGRLFMTATVLTRSDTAHPESSAVTFILTGDKLVTLRYADPAAFHSFHTRREANLQRYQTNYQFLGGLIDAIIERVADILEGVGTKLDVISQRVFEPEHSRGSVGFYDNLKSSAHGKAGQSRGSERLIGAASDLISRTRESHASFLSAKVSFLLDATLGMINNEQNAIIKILSVAALVFLPPTLVAGVYGMNFHFMPELGWVHGYPMALLIMIISAVLPYLVFRQRGWL